MVLIEGHLVLWYQGQFDDDAFGAWDVTEPWEASSP